MAGKLKEQVNKAYIEAMKAKDTVAKNILILVKSGILQVEKDSKVTLDDQGVMNVISKMIKKAKDSEEMFAQGGRQDLVDQTKREIEILSVYMPEAMSADELTALVKEVIAETGAESPRDIGKVMGLAIKKAEGRAEGSEISKIAKELLS